MKKLTRKETAKINGGIAPGQCFYIDPNTGKRTLGCQVEPIPDCCGGWIYPLPGHTCQSCNPVIEL
ncbi:MULTISPECIES: hypothetical protein [Chryseobacterium]|uniref:Bacteriocin n=1 Tax=Chryseobacterium jejuense TaxID=445960 RepID=A0A2X2XGN0_CHRJE|nr:MULTISPECIES: hypothetical protein [Chryseobacterium]RXM52160.1 hypothetical protein BOQ64_09975 [Chryseobacterium sp. CH25]RXM64073.1 hypothetical protein BOQ60_14345 [Chryseobacterium sp. CH1]SDI61643.1 hypothetical protein SAMN05421542_1494 [Chryseobacterium jejuense]SQB47225.1 Uncharacterised protein [Chryseobacterium jejuense]